MNAWWLENHRREIRYQINHAMNGYTKPYFTDETGRLFRDETGTLDHNDTIPMQITTGRNNFGDELSKNYVGAVVSSERARGTQVSARVDSGEWKPLGQIFKPNHKLTFPDGVRGTDVNYNFTHNSRGATPIIDGVTTYYSREELTF